MRAIYVLCLVALFSSAATAQQTREFRDWKVQCDDFDKCSASFALDSDPTDYLKPDLELVISRDPFATFWSLHVETNAPRPVENGDWTLQVDGRTFTFSEPQSLNAYGDLYDFYFRGDQAQPLLDALIVGTQATISYPGQDNGQHTAQISLSGIAAALLWIDEKQARLGSERVIGDAPQGLQRVHTREPAAMDSETVAKIQEFSDCEEPEYLPHGNDAESYRLDAENTLHMIPCTAGAYNFAYELYVQNSSYTRRLAFAEYYEGTGWTGTTALVNVYYNPHDQTLSMFNKARGIGDCGTTGLWQWNGYDFRMLEYTSKDVCDALGGPDTFPIAYRAPDYDPPASD